MNGEPHRAGSSKSSSVQREKALARGMPVAMVVLLIRDAASMPGSMQRWVADLRAQMRASDLAGMWTRARSAC